MTSINFVSTTRIATSTIQSYEVKLWDTTSNLYNPITLSNNFLLVNGQPLQGGGNFASSMSTFQTYTSTLFVGPSNQFSFTALFPLDVAGTARFQEISTQSIQASLISTTTLLASTTFTSLISSQQATFSTITTQFISTQNASVRSNFVVGGSNASTPGFIINISSQIGLNLSAPQAQLHVKDLPYATADVPMMIFDKDPTTVNTVTQAYTGVYVFYTVPSAVFSITFNLWGAGGGSAGGGGAFVQGNVPVTPGEQLRLIIGLKGDTTNTNSTDAQGGGGDGQGSGQDGRGGGRTAVQKFINGVWTEVLTAGGGGGGTSAFGGAGGGNAFWVGTSQRGQGLFGGSGGGGGSATAAGLGDSGGGNGSFQRGGISRFLGGAGGGGYFGGGGGHGGGGGGSFALSTLNGAAFVTNYNGINGSGGTPIGTNIPGYTSGISVTGANGHISFEFNGFREGDYIDLNRGGTTVFVVNASGNVGISKNVVTPNYALDVNGNLLASNATTTLVSSQNILASSITTSNTFSQFISTSFLQASTLSTTNLFASSIAGGLLQVSTIRTNEVNFIDIASNAPYQVVLSNQTFLIDGKPLQTGGFASSLSTYQIFASTLQLSDPSLFNFTAEFNLDITGTARITNYLSVGTVYTGAQHVGLQFG